MILTFKTYNFITLIQKFKIGGITFQIMGKYINKKTIVDEETGEIIKEVNWFGYDGFNEKGYRYRKSAESITVYYDALPQDLSKDAFLLLTQLAEFADKENVLVYRIPRKSKFSNILYKPYDKETLREKLRYKMGINKFNECWSELNKHCIKRVEFRDMKVFALNPAIIMKGKILPYWLYYEFKDYINPYLSANAIKKFKNKIDEIIYGE